MSALPPVPIRRGEPLEKRNWNSAGLGQADVSVAQLPARGRIIASMADQREVWFNTGLGTAIIADPGNDDLRYAFANAIEQDESQESPNRARAEFIRVQLKLSELSPSHAEYMRLATRAYALELRHREQWIQGLLREFRKVEFHRGFVELAAVPARILRDNFAPLFEESPLQHLDIVELQDAQELRPLLGDLAESGYLQKLVSLGLDGQRLTNDSLRILSDAPFERLRWLSLAYNQINEGAADILLRGSFRNLRFVNLQGNPFDPSAQLFYDQGIVIEQREDERYARLTEIPWLTKTVRGGQYVQPDRFAVNS